MKLGTQVVTQDGRSLALGRVMSLVEEMALLRLEGRQIILVSSGAVALGMKQLGLEDRPRSLGLRQACAAFGAPGTSVDLASPATPEAVYWALAAARRGADAGTES